MDFNVSPLQSAGWHTASATGAVNYMSYEEVQRFSAAYQNSSSSAKRAIGHFELLSIYNAKVTHDPRAMKPQDVESAIGDVRQVMADVKTMSDITRGTLPLYDEALKQ